MKRAYVSALGIMGRRHVVGLVRKGYHVDCFDPSDAAHEALASDLERNSLDSGLVQRVEAGNGTGDVKGFRISFDVFNAIEEALLALLYFQYH